MITRFRLVLWLAAASLLACETVPVPVTDDNRHLPETALQQLQVADGLELSLFAAEPMIINPTNIDVDDRGRVWVCEAYNYRMAFNATNPTREAGDRILILEDTDGDGQADQRKVFYEGTDINAALGIAVIGNQVIVSCSPQVLVFTDDNGDDVPDKKEVLFSGIDGIQDDHGIHAFVFGPDGRYYFNGGNAARHLSRPDGTPITDKWSGNLVSTTDGPYRQGMVFRYDPGDESVEVLGHNFRNIYEVAVDSYGTLWQSDNDDDGNKGVRINYVMPYGNYGYTDEITGAGWQTARVGVEDAIPHRHWHLNDPGVVPNLLQTGAGSPTGIVVYEGTQLPDSFRNEIIHCDAGPNVVRSYPASPDGAGYTASISNLLTSPGNQWFRPSDVCVAPDGSLLIADWYDPVVGGNQMGDQERGRIFRLAANGAEYHIPKPDYRTAEGAASALCSPNLATRSKSWLALSQMGEQAEPVLRVLAEDSNPVFQARALWLLARLPNANTYLQQAFADPNPDVRITAIRAAQANRLLSLNQLSQLATDPSAQVQREVALALRFEEGLAADRIWASLATQLRAEDRWMVEALGIGSDRFADDRFDTWIEMVGDNWNTPAGRQIIWRSRADAAIPYLEQLIRNAETAAAATPYLRALHFHPDRRTQPVLERIMNGNHPEQAAMTSLAIRCMKAEQIRRSAAVQRKVGQVLADLFETDPAAFLTMVESIGHEDSGDRLFALAMNPPEPELGNKATWLLNRFGQLDRFTTPMESGDPVQVNRAISALSILGNRNSFAILKAFCTDPAQDMSYRKQAVQALAKGWFGEDLAGEWLQNDDSVEPEIREAAAVVMLGAIKSHWREYAAEVLNVADGDFPPMEELMTFAGDSVKGKEAFAAYCAACHQIDGAGIRFGPDLSEIGSKLPKEGLYTAVIRPSAGINFGYEGYLVETQSGENYLGYLTSATDEGITLRMTGGTDMSIPKDNIRSMLMQDNSLMTPGLHQAMGPQTLADVVAYLEGRTREDE